MVNHPTSCKSRSSRNSFRVLMLLVLIGMLCRHSYQLGLRRYYVQKQANYTNGTNAAQQPASSKAKAKAKSTSLLNELPPRAHRVDKSKLPYKCGLVFFYHIQSTGGATIEQWLREYTPSKNSTTATHFQHWGRKKEQTPDRYKVQELFIHGNLDNQDTEKDIPKHQHHVLGMNNFVTNIQPNEWRIAHCHHSSMNLNITEQYLTEWRSIIEEQGCAFIANVMFRDALSHALSLFKHIRGNNIITSPNDAREEWVSHLYSRSNMGQWQSQLDYFLYNFLDRNPDGVDSKTKVKRALQLLHDHFDIVSVDNHDRYKKELLSMTGWPSDIEMKRTNTYRGRELTFTKKEVEEMQKLLYDNGDIEFIYQVNKLYGSQAE